MGRASLKKVTGAVPLPAPDAAVTYATSPNPIQRIACLLSVFTRTPVQPVNVCQVATSHILPDGPGKLFNMPDIELNFTPELAQYIRSVSRSEPQILEQLRQETAALPDARMQISPEQGRFFQFLIRATGARQCLEVGVFTGYSSTAVALALPEDGRITACDVSAEWTAIARRYWRDAGVEHKIALHLAPAVETLDRLIAGGAADTYDFAFIDADKGNYPLYWERALTLVRSGGAVAVDNVLWSGKVADESVRDETTGLLREFNRQVAADARVSTTILAMRDGITLAYKF